MTPLSLTQNRLLAVLATLSPAPLKGLALLETPAGLTDRETVRAAVLDLMAYTDGCTQALERLASLPAVPLTAFVCADWAL